MGDPLRLYGLNALVLNGGSGIGEAVARTLVKHGSTVLAVDTTNSGVDRHFASVKGITGMTANLVDPDQMPGLIQDAVDELGGIDILVNEFPLSFEMPMDGSSDKLDRLLPAYMKMKFASLQIRRQTSLRAKSAPSTQAPDWPGITDLKSCFGVEI